jgi:uncharacterized membrane protein YfcA
MVPLLLVVFERFGVSDVDLLFHLAAGTSLAVIVPTSMSSTWTHHRHGKVIWKSVVAMTPAGLLAVHLASVVAARTAGSTLKTAFGVLLIGVSAQLLFHAPRPRKGPPPLPLWLTFILIGTVAGSISYFFGVGGGLAAVPLLVLLAGVSIHEAVGTSSALIVFLALYGTVRNVWIGQGVEGLPANAWGYVNVLSAACIMPTSIWMARVGANLANAVQGTFLRRLFAILVALEGFRLAFG